MRMGDFRATTRERTREVRSFFRHLSKNDAANGCDCAVLAIRMALRERRERNGDQAGATGDDSMASEGRFRRKRASGAVLGRLSA